MCLVIAAGTALGFVKIAPKVQGVSSVAGGEQVVDDATETKLELIQALIDLSLIHIWNGKSDQKNSAMKNW